MQSLADIRAGTIDQFLAWWLTNAVLPAAEQKMFDHYYRSYRRHFGPYVRRYYARQSRELVDLIRARRAPRVLEVGCGCAPNPCGPRSRAATSRASTSTPSCRRWRRRGSP